MTVSREKVTWHGAIIKKPGEGMPNYDNNNLKGTLYITVEVDFPKRAFSPEEKEGGCIAAVVCVCVYVCSKVWLVSR